MGSQTEFGNQRPVPTSLRSEMTQESIAAAILKKKNEFSQKETKVTKASLRSSVQTPFVSFVIFCPESALLGQLYPRGHFRRWFGNPAVMLAVGEVEDEADNEPDKQPHPVRPAETIDHRAAYDDAKDGDERRRRHAEAAFQLRTPHAHDPNPGAYENEGEQRSYARHFAYDIFGDECGENPCEDEKENVRFERRPEARVHIGKDLRHESVAAHGKEDARLTKKHDENHRGEAGQNRNGD
jgi:hypothetical protein